MPLSCIHSTYCDVVFELTDNIKTSISRKNPRMMILSAFQQQFEGETNRLRKNWMIMEVRTVKANRFLKGLEVTHTLNQTERPVCVGGKGFNCVRHVA